MLFLIIVVVIIISRRMLLIILKYGWCMLSLILRPPGSQSLKTNI
jgi:hypothetical protein